MTKIESLTAIILLSIIAIYFAKVALRSIFNIVAMHADRKQHDRAKQKNGIVFNTKEGRLEADQSFMLPF